MTFNIDLTGAERPRLRIEVPHWKLTSADKKKLEGVILTTATLGMIAVVLVRFYTLFAPLIAL